MLLVAPLSCDHADASEHSPRPPAHASRADLESGFPPDDAATLDVGEWNIEWFGSMAGGPPDKPLQLRNASEVIRHVDMDVWGLEEIIDAGEFNRLLSRLPGYAGFLANDPMVARGSDYYAEDEMKVGILYRPDTIAVRSARVILGDHEYDFAGRPPLEVHIEVRTPNGTSRLVLIVLHAKAGADPASYQQRKRGAVALKSYLDHEHPKDKVLVVGDFNDDIDTSISRGRPSSYRNFVNDRADYTFVTEELSQAAERSTSHYNSMVNHHLATNELAASFIEGSAEVIRPDEHIPRFGFTTSDHYPTVSRYRLGR
jgi:endonuclease/exonuclease/phosphatase family metal-dependent hydrolase